MAWEKTTEVLKFLFKGKKAFVPQNPWFSAAAAATVVVGVPVAGVAAKKWHDHSVMEREIAMLSLEPLGFTKEEAARFAEIFSDAYGEIKYLYTPVKEFKKQGGDKNDILGWTNFAKKWVVNQARRAGQNFGQNLLEDLQPDPNKKSSPIGMLLGAVGLGGLGAWLGGGGWTGFLLGGVLALVGGALGQNFLSIGSDATANANQSGDKKTPAKNQERHASNAHTISQPAVVVPVTPTVVTQGPKPGQKTSGAAPAV